MRVLVVDDSKVVLSIVQTYLMKLRAEFEVAGTAEEGLEAFLRAPADVIVTDYHLPGMNGIQLAQRVRELAGNDVKILLISSARDLNPDDAKSRGFVDGFLPKPLDGIQLQEEVERMVHALASESPHRASLVPNTKISVVAADDTEVGRRIMERIICADTRFELLGIARDGAEAVDMVTRLRPGLVLLDALMPILDGIAATRRIMQAAPSRVVIVTEHHSMQGASVAFAAQRAGALDLLPRPSWGDPAGPQATAFRERLKDLAEVPVIGQRQRGALPRRPLRQSRERSHAGVIAMCSSTGGPAVLAGLLPRLKPCLETSSILIVQHVLSGFDVALAEWLGDVTKCRVELAASGAVVAPGKVLMAPDGRHMRLVARDRVEVYEGAPVGGHRPSGDPLFESVAKFYGAESLAVVLTGMGSDGVHGCLKVRAAGGCVLVQSPETCVVPGMPDAVIQQASPHAVLPPDELAAEIRERVAVR